MIVKIIDRDLKTLLALDGYDAELVYPFEDIALDEDESASVGFSFVIPIDRVFDIKSRLDVILESARMSIDGYYGYKYLLYARNGRDRPVRFLIRGGSCSLKDDTIFNFSEGDRAILDLSLDLYSCIDVVPPNDSTQSFVKTGGAESAWGAKTTFTNASSKPSKFFRIIVGTDNLIQESCYIGIKDTRHSSTIANFDPKWNAKDANFKGAATTTVTDTGHATDSQQVVKVTLNTSAEFDLIRMRPEDTTASASHDSQFIGKYKLAFRYRMSATSVPVKLKVTRYQDANNQSRFSTTYLLNPTGTNYEIFLSDTIAFPDVPYYPSDQSLSFGQIELTVERQVATTVDFFLHRMVLLPAENFLVHTGGWSPAGVIKQFNIETLPTGQLVAIEAKNINLSGVAPEGEFRIFPGPCVLVACPFNDDNDETDTDIDTMDVHITNQFAGVSTAKNDFSRLYFTGV